MCGALVLVLFVVAFVVYYKINEWEKKQKRSIQIDLDILEYKLIQFNIRCSKIEDDMKKLREEFQ